MKMQLICVLIALAMFSTAARATTECTGKVTRIWTGDDGGMWVNMDSGVVWYIIQGDPDMKNILALSTTAMVTDRSVTVRFAADGVGCTSGARGDVQGIYLNQ